MDDEALPCGARLGALWEEGVPEAGHRECAHCRAALDDLAALDRAVRQAVANGPPAREDFASRVMKAVRTELRPGRTLPLGEPADDDWITEAAAARVLRSAADSIPGIVAGSCRILPLRPTTRARLPVPLPGARLPREPLRIRMKVAISPWWTVPKAAAAVRARVAKAAREQLGLDVPEIDVAVTDLLDEPDTPDGRRAG